MDLDTQFIRFYIFWTAATLIATMLGVWVSYLIIKNAVRDGIRESGLLDALRRERAPERSRTESLPRMTID